MPEITTAQRPNVATEVIKTGTTAQMKPQMSAPVEGVQQTQAPQQQTQAAPEQDQRLAHMAAKERELREMQRQNQSERQEMAALRQKIAELEGNTVPKSRLQEKPYETLVENGVAYDKVTEQALQALNSNDPVARVIADLQSQVKELKSYNEQTQTAAQEAQTSQYQQAIKAIENDVVMTFKAKPEEYPILSNIGAQKQVAKLIESIFNKGLPDNNGGFEYEKGTVLPVEIAARILEDEHLAKFKKIAEASPKVREQLGLAQAGQTGVQKGNVSQGLKTITNDLSAQKPMSRRDRAIAAGKGLL